MSKTAAPPPLPSWERDGERVSGNGARRPGARTVERELTLATPVSSLCHRRRGLIWTFLAALFALIATPAFAQGFPKFSNFVVDQANILPPAAEARLNRELADLQRQTRHQLAIATVPDLQGYAIEDYSLRLARAWGVGRRHYDDGVLLLVAPRERKVRIEVGYGLEATLTDPRCATIIRDRILPRFRERDLPGGVSAGADAIVALLKAAAPLERPHAS